MRQETKSKKEVKQWEQKMDYLNSRPFKKKKKKRGTQSNLSFNSFRNNNKFPALRALEKKFKKKLYL